MLRLVVLPRFDLYTIHTVCRFYSSHVTVLVSHVTVLASHVTVLVSHVIVLVSHVIVMQSLLDC